MTYPVPYSLLTKAANNYAGSTAPGDIYGIYSGLSSGTPQGYLGAGANAAKLYGTWADDSAIGQGAGAALGALGVAGGIEKGGVAGDTQAAVGAAQLADQAGTAAGATGAGMTALDTIGEYAPLIGSALQMYEAVNSPAVQVTPGYYQSMAQDIGDPNSPNHLGSMMEANASSDPAEHALLQAYGITPDLHPPTTDYQPWQWYQSPDSSTLQNGARPSIRAAAGGSMTDKNIHNRLKELYKGSFAKRHYDIGGGVDDSGDTGPSWLPSIDPIFPTGATPGVSSPTPAIWSPSDSGGDSASSDSSSSNNSILGPGGSLSGLGSLLGVSSMGQLVQQYGALAPLIAAALGGNKPASAPGTPTGYGAIPSVSASNYSRPYTQPQVANWYTYGEGPEQSFFGNNQTPYVPGVSPASAAPGASSTSQGSSPASASAPAPYMGGPSPGVQMRAQGGSTFDSTQGDSYVQDPGAGNGTSDDIDAKLSGGEYVMDAGTVSMLGNGSNEAGARALDQLRQRVRQHAGKHLVKGKQFMKAKAPEAYLKGGKT
jgi:hypothetical protein